MRKKKTLFVAAGGTGGHVFPAQALAEELLRRGWDVHFVSDERGISVLGEAVSKVGHLHLVQTGNLNVRSGRGRILSLGKVISGFWRALCLFYGKRPVAVVGFGGFPSLPVMGASLFYPVKRFLHEQNRILGRVNRLFLPFVHKVAVSMPLLGLQSPKVCFTGMPVRSSVGQSAGAPYSFSSTCPLTFVVIGGSQGAQIFSQRLPFLLHAFSKGYGRAMRIIQQCRPENLEETRRTYEKLGLEVELSPFIDTISEVLVKAHLVISRSGASSIADIMTVGRPSLLVPYPGAMDDHQTANAQYVQKEGAGWFFSEQEMTKETVVPFLRYIFAHPQMLEEAAEKARQQGSQAAVSRLSALIETEVKG